MSFPNPSPSQIRAAFDRHGVRYRIEPVLSSSAGRPWSSGLRAIVDHHTAGTNSLRFLQNSGGSMPFVQTLIRTDGLCHVLTWLSCWGSGAGGPWSGVAARDSLHLTGWQNEVESLGRTRDFTPAQIETLGRINAALVSLGVPAANEVNHRDWTDGTGGVGGFPLPTRGRKIDTLYDTAWLRQNTARYRIGTTPPPTTPEPEEVPTVVIIRNASTSACYLLTGPVMVPIDGTSLNGLRAAGIKVADCSPAVVNALIADAGQG